LYLNHECDQIQYLILMLMLAENPKYCGLYLKDISFLTPGAHEGKFKIIVTVKRWSPLWNYSDQMKHLDDSNTVISYI